MIRDVAAPLPPTGADSIALVRDPLSVTFRCDDRELRTSTLDSYAGFVDAYAGTAPGGVVLDCVIDPGRLNRLLESSAPDAVVRAAGSGHTAARAVSSQAQGDTVLVLGGRDGGSRSILQRELRIIFARQFIEAGWLPLHAAAVTSACAATTARGRSLGDQPGGAVLLMGPKRAGKTTTLLRLLRAGAAGLVANDKVFVRAAPGIRPELRSLPVSIGVRADTLGLFPELAALKGQAGDLHVDNHASGDGRLIVPLPVLARAFDTKVTPVARLAAVAAVRFSPGLSCSRIRHLPAGDLANLLDRERLDHCAHWQENWLGRSSGSHQSARGASTVIAGLEEIVAWSVDLASGDDDVLHRLLSAEVPTPEVVPR
jgi:hypothetical protein